jgi:hypothetical protein
MATLTHITTSGGLISAAFLDNIREPGSRQRGVEPASFALPATAGSPRSGAEWGSPAPKSPAALEDTIATAWELLLERWDAVRNDLPLMDVRQVRARWLLPLFQLLDFDPVYLRGDTILDPDGKLRFPLSHRGWPGDGAPILHTVAPTQGLDGRMAGARGVKAKSPHDMLQAFLNASPIDQWAVLSNGVLLRLLRDYHHTFTKGYVEFDLESIFETRNYGDFRALYRLGHASRFLARQTSEVSETSEVAMPLEQFYRDSIATGVKVGEDLRGQVRQAIETLGNGFLDGELIRQLQQDEDLCRAYYGEILHIIYRILFLLFAEQRGMMPGRDSLYAESYSIASLRARAEGDLPREDDFTDLWEGLKVTFRMVREGVPALGVFGYDGMLFEDVGADGRPPLLADRSIRNSDLLRAVRALTLIEREGVLQRISYADLGVEELGSIYESLLDYTPHVSIHADQVNGRDIPAHTFFLDPRGSERKTTGSYYTHPSLVNELIKSALLPVARARLAAAGLPAIEEAAIGEAAAGLLADYAGLTAEQRAAGEAALLSLKVCDPAAGSGHFLVKANNALGAELARLRSSDEYPSETEVQAAKRDVLAHCLYAVDLNPMAVELCKVSLWINASVRDRPLSFLDHHIKCGNSLIGATPELMAGGIPEEAFALGIAGDDPATARRFRARSRQERHDYEQGAGYQLGLKVTVIETLEDLRRWTELAQLAEDEPSVARERYVEYLAADEHRRHNLEADFWTAAFFWPMPAVGAQGAAPSRWAPTFAEFLRLREQGPEALPAERLLEVEALAEQARFFHWHLEFPEVFLQTSEVSETSEVSGGFDVVLGNPPWERIKLQEKEFFAGRDAGISNASTAAQRRKLIARLPKTNPALAAEYAAALRDSEAASHLLRDSGRFPLTAGGDINLYAVFAGLARQLIAPDGRAGLVVPTGIATDYTYRDFFADVVASGQLASLYDFENREGLFPGTHRSYKFSLLTLTGGGAGEADFAFFLHTAGELADPERRFPLGKDHLALMNPNTRTVPVFRTRRDTELTRKLYRAAPVLHNEQAGENPWGVSFLRMFDMTNDSGLFRTREQLEAQGYELDGNRFVCGDDVLLPLYEGRMIGHYDHRCASVGISEKEVMRSGVTLETSLDEHREPTFYAMPRYWVVPQYITERVPGDHKRGWFIGFKDVTSPTNERTLICSTIPRTAVGNKVPLLLTERSPEQACGFVANLSAYVFDFVVRQKIGGVSLNFFIVKQLPVLPPDRYTPNLLDFIVPRVVELTYTAWDLQAFTQDVLAEVGPATWARWFQGAPVHSSPPPAWAAGLVLAPFVWDEARRARLRAELDALYAHLYGLTREELAYILDTFPIVRRKDEARWGEYRTKRMVLEEYDAMKGKFG